MAVRQGDTVPQLWRTCTFVSTSRTRPRVHAQLPVLVWVIQCNTEVVWYVRVRIPTSYACIHASRGSSGEPDEIGDCNPHNVLHGGRVWRAYYRNGPAVWSALSLMNPYACLSVCRAANVENGLLIILCASLILGYSCRGLLQCPRPGMVFIRQMSGL